MDELEISGRRFLSTRRAAKDHKYTSDYVGQLIRGGKVVGKKVGRSWYVDEQSLNAYLSGETAPTEVAKVVLEEKTPVLTSPVPETIPTPAPVQPVAKVEPVHIVPEVEVIAPAPMPTSVLEIKKEEPVVLTKIVEEQTFEPVIIKSSTIDEHHIPIRTQMRAPEKFASGLRYVTDDEPAIPEIKKKVSLTTAPAMRATSLPVIEEDVSIEEDVVEVMPRKRYGALALAGVLLIAVATFSATAALSANLNSHIVVEQGQVAGVGYSFK